MKDFGFKPKYILIIVLILLAAVLIYESVFVVDQTEQAVVTRFGEFVRVEGPGLHVKIPFFERSQNVQTQLVQNMAFGFRSDETLSMNPLLSASDYPDESVMLTGDLNIIDIEWIVQYRIVDPVGWLFNVYDREKTIRDISRSVMNQLVGDLPILSVMTSERTRIEAESQYEMQRILDSYGSGVEIITVKLQNIVPPVGDVQDAFEDVNKAIQDMNRLINEGKENYNKEIPAAEGEAAQIVQEAMGYASERVNTARGDVARFNAVHDAYSRSEDITALRLYIETMEDVLSSHPETTYLIDKNLENFLPISNLTTNSSTNSSVSGGAK